MSTSKEDANKGGESGTLLWDMRNEPDASSAGTVVLRGVPVALNTDVGLAFVIDCARNLEGALSDAEITGKWGLSEENWASLANNGPLVAAVRAERERRILSGHCAREAAQRHYAGAPNVLGGILSDERISARHRIEAARELRQAAGNDPRDVVPREKIKITINLGGDERLERECTPNFPEPADDGDV